MKGVIILVILILVLAGFLSFKILSPEVNNVEEKMSKEEVIQLLEKGTEVDNYIAKYVVEMDGKEQEVIKIVKNNIVILKTETMYTWDNLDTKEEIVLNYDRKVAIYSNESGIGVNKSKSLPAQNEIMGFINDDEYEYKYIKEDEIEKNKYIVIELSCKYEKGEYKFFNASNEKAFELKFKIWINKDSGMVTKYELKAKDDTGEDLETTVEYDIQLNIVQDKDIEKPSLDGYEVINMDEY